MFTIFVYKLQKMQHFKFKYVTFQRNLIQMNT